MKKVLALIMVLCMSLGLLVSCNSEIYAQYASAMEKTNALKSVQGTMNINMEMKYSGMTIELPITSEFKQRIDDNGKLTMYQKISTEMMGQKMDIDQYYSDGFYYQEIMGMKIKQEMPVEDMGKMSVADLKKEDLLTWSFEKVEKGTKFSATVEGSAIDKYLNNLMSGMDEELTVIGEAGQNTTFSNADLYFIIDKDGYVCEVYLKVTVNTSMEMPDLNGGEDTVKTDVACMVEATISFKELGKDVTIELPDLSEYSEDIGLGDLGDLEDLFN